MTFKSGAAKLSQSGRKAGTPNKFTASVKDAFEFAFDEIGGAAALAAWAKDNQTAFYKIYSKMLPTDAALSIAAPEIEKEVASHVDEWLANLLKQIENKKDGLPSITG